MVEMRTYRFLWLFAIREVLSTHYGATCGNDESLGEVQGETGSICAPRCSEGTFQCMNDLPEGTSAVPQCMLTDIDHVPHCGLLCQVDSQCPSGATCKAIQEPRVGICIHALSFGDWARGSRKKFSVAFPSTGSTSQSGFQVAKAFSALQNLKQRFGIGNGDADVLIIKELLTSSTAAASGSVPIPAQTSAGSGGGAVRGLGFDAWKHDVNYLSNNLKQGIPGIGREIKDTIWNVEHITNYGVATELLRGVILIAIAYLVIGCAYKYQAEGARGISMIPHIGFWKEYPRLVSDGWTYAFSGSR